MTGALAWAHHVGMSALCPKLTLDTRRQAGSRNFAVGDVVINVFASQPLAGFIGIDLTDNSAFSQLINDEIALHVGVGVRGMRDLKCELR